MGEEGEERKLRDMDRDRDRVIMDTHREALLL